MSAGSALHWRPRAFLLLAGGVALLTVAVAVRSPVPVFVALPLLLAPIVAVATAPSGRLAATLAWRAEGEGPQVEIEGLVSAPSPLRPRDLLVEFEPCEVLPSVAPPSLERGRDRIRFRLHFRAPEPTVVVVPPPRVVWTDAVGLIERDVDARFPELVVERYPPELNRMGAVRLDRTLALPGEIRSRRIGASGEFFGIRDAAPTDPPNRINWKASARSGRLLSNEFELDRAADVLLLIDARPTQLGGTMDDRLLGVARAAARGIADALLAEKLRVGYAAFGEFVEAVPLSSGRIHRVRIHRAILGTRRATVAGPSERCPVALRRLFPPGLTTLLISNLGTLDALDLVPHLRRRGYPVVVLSPSPLSVASRWPPLAEADEQLALRLATLDRRERLSSTWNHAPVVDWSDFWSLAGLVHLLRHPGRGRGT